MDPYESFYDFFEIFGNLDDNICYLTNGYEKLCNDFLLNGKLSHPIEDCSVLFLSNVSEIVNKIFDFNLLHKSSLDTYLFQVLLRSFRLVPICFKLANFKVLSSLKRIVKKDSYQYLDESYRSNIIVECNKFCIFRDLVDVIEHNPSLEHCSFFYELFFDVNPSSEYYSQFAIAFFKFLIRESGNDFKNFDFKLANQLFERILNSAQLFNQECFPYYSSLLEIAENCITKGNLERKTFGANVIANIKESIANDSVDSYRDWQNSTLLMSFMLESEVHVSIWDRLRKVLPKIIQPDQMKLAVKRLSSYHKTYQKYILNIISKCSHSVSEVQLEDLIDMLKITISESELCVFLFDSLKKLIKEHEDDKALTVFRRISKLDSDLINESLDNSKNYRLPNAIVSECLDLLKTSNVDIVLNFLLCYIDSIDHSEFLPQLIFIASSSSPLHRNKAHRLIIKILVSTHKSLDKSNMSALLANSDSYFYEFISSLILACKSFLYCDNYASACLRMNLINFKGEVNVLAAKAMINFFIIENIREGIITVRSSEIYDISAKVERYSGNLGNMELIHNIFSNCTNDEILKELLEKLCNIALSNDIAPSCTMLFDIYCRSNSVRAKTYGIRLICKYIDSLEKDIVLDDYGYSRHKNNSDTIGVTVMSTSDESNCLFFINKSARVSNLSRRIEDKFGYVRNSAVLKLNDEVMNVNIEIASYCLDQNSVITVSGKRDTVHHISDPPTVHFLKKGILGHLYSNLDEDEMLSKEASIALDMFPHYQEALRIFDDTSTLSDKLNVKPYKLKYILDILNEKLANESAKVYVGVCEVLYKNLKSGGYDSCYNDILTAILHASEGSTLLQNQEFLSSMIRELDKDENFEVAARILLKARPSILQSCVEKEQNIEVIIKILSSYHCPQLSYIRDILKRVSKVSHIMLVLFDSIRDTMLCSRYYSLVPDLVGGLEYNVASTIFQNAIKLDHDMLSLPDGWYEAVLELCKHFKFQFDSSDLFFILLELKNDRDRINVYNFLYRTGNITKDYIKILLDLRKNNLFSYSQEKFSKSCSRPTGLKNLGVTCYLNSVLQSLFYTRNFKKKLSEFQTENVSIRALKDLFTYMDHTLKKSSNPQQFIDTWNGWNNSMINKHEQQDAYEFLIYLLDYLPREITADFCGLQSNTIENTGEKYESKNDERFFVLELEIKGCTNIQDSFLCYLQKENLTDIFREDLGRRIDCVKYSRIKTPPNILIIHLRRFDFDIFEGTMKKLDDKFEFQETLDISSLLEHSQGLCEYELYSIIFHSGDAQGGHYLSWCKFNDMGYLFDDECVKYETFSGLSFGYTSSVYGSSIYDRNINQSPYILFYVKKDYIECEKGFKFPSTSSVEEDNIDFAKKQIVFSSVFSQNIKESDDDLILKYFVDIYTHSDLNEGIRGFDIIDRLSVDSFASKALDYFNERKDDIFSYILQISIDEILEKLCVFIENLIKKFSQSNERVKEFMSHMLMRLNETSEYLRKIPYLAGIVYCYVCNCLHADKNLVVECIYSLLLSIYNGGRSSAYLENINLDKILLCIKETYTGNRPELVDIIVNESESIRNRYSTHSYFLLLKHLYQEKYIEESDYINIILDSDGSSEEKKEAFTHMIKELNREKFTDIISFVQKKKCLDQFFSVLTSSVDCCTDLKWILLDKLDFLIKPVVKMKHLYKNFLDLFTKVISYAESASKSRVLDVSQKLVPLIIDFISENTFSVDEYDFLTKLLYEIMIFSTYPHLYSKVLDLYKKTKSIHLLLLLFSYDDFIKENLDYGTIRDLCTNATLVNRDMIYKIFVRILSVNKRMPLFVGDNLPLLSDTDLILDIIRLDTRLVTGIFDVYNLKQYSNIDVHVRIFNEFCDCLKDKGPLSFCTEIIERSLERSFLDNNYKSMFKNMGKIHFVDHKIDLDLLFRKMIDYRTLSDALHFICNTLNMHPHKSASLYNEIRRSKTDSDDDMFNIGVLLLVINDVEPSININEFKIKEYFVRCSEWPYEILNELFQNNSLFVHIAKLFFSKEFPKQDFHTVKFFNKCVNVLLWNKPNNFSFLEDQISEHRRPFSMNKNTIEWLHLLMNNHDNSKRYLRVHLDYCKHNVLKCDYEFAKKLGFT